MSELGIDITKQKIGNTLLVETEDGRLYEMKVIMPEKGVLEVQGTDSRLKTPVLGVLTHAFSDDKKIQINHWIGHLLKMALVFRNGNLESTPVVHATVKGERWSYDVF